MKDTVYLKGNRVNLSPNDYVTAGGEGKIFVKSGLVYKVYHDPMPNGKEQKLKSLSVLSHKAIVAPKDLLYSQSGEPVGYTMPFVDNSSALALLFTSSFKKRNGITRDNLDAIFLGMSETIGYVHGKDILLVDANELNFLVSNADWETVKFIDVDSFQTKDFPATAIMPSVRDFRSATFSRETDWYSFSVLMFQLYAGIHPYLGTHPKYNVHFVNGTEVKFDDIETRRKALVSVYDKDVKFPPCVKLTDIPSGLKDWFVAMFEDGKSSPPPTAIQKGQAPTQVTTYSSQGITEALLKEFDEVIQRVKFVRGQVLVVTPSAYWLGGQRHMKSLGNEFGKELPIVFERNGNVSILHAAMDGEFLWADLDGMRSKELVPGLLGIGAMNNRLFALADGTLREYGIGKYTNALSVVASWNVLARASKFYPGCVYCDSFGTAMFYVAETKDDNDVLHVLKVPELDGHLVLDALYSNGTLVVMSANKGKYVKTVVKFDCFFLKYAIDQTTCELQEINATVTSTGMLVILDRDSMELSARGGIDKKVVKVDTDLTLSSRGSEVLGFRDKSLFKLTLG